ncbi:peptide chain release factor N(5)-glutamine methyltransferase [Candidatus Methylobacter oryzae]|uniref:peptide chain release factor N(5)-glutamine methyltransferase n=1 Tax=Candidatus Methylobacter oryzae TaxID=2497749 RepID=A0ABY3C8D8_9GAMM|nr:peptide chain release factor N(5)-glutamine methyltransferase [Candidatus Methylobacter oryzae]TRW92068.1 peptide chain release factor N(5)-glutamine methyltransferase [Candidatus Methylobacter oryzae]
MFLGNENLYNLVRPDLENKLNLLKDKPEENIDSTLKALGFAALGLCKSAETAAKLPFPELTEEHKNRLFELLNQRLDSTPLAHITGRQSFMGIEFLCDERALIPRKETEILGYKALGLSQEIAKEKQRANIIDVCCGSGNLGLAIVSHNAQAYVYATDLSAEAVELTQENISFLNLGDRINVRQGDLLSAFETEDYFEKIDLIVCNPPYIPSASLPKMNTEILAHEPVLAFDGGVMGISLIQKLILEAPRFLTKSGALIFEVGVGQGRFASRLCQRSGLYSHIESISDDSGNIRVILARK